MNFKLSPSTISLMEECPRCFWLSQHNIWKRPIGIFPSLPSGMDNILKKHFDNFIEKEKLPPELCNNSQCKNLKLFSDKELLNNWRDAKRGLWFKDESGNVLHGGLDNLLVNKANNKLIVLDYKTRGFPLKENTHEHYQNQMNIYSWLLEKIGYRVEDFAYLLFYYPKEVLQNGEIVFDKILKKIKVKTSDAEKIFEKAISILNGKCPKEKCEWCANV